MKRHIIILLAILIATLTVEAKDVSRIDNLMLKADVHPIEPEADAAYLIKEDSISFESNVWQNNTTYMIIKRHRRIKIYSDGGEDYGQFNIPLYNNNGIKERVTDIEAITYNWKNGEAKENQLADSDIYKEETSENWSIVKFALPNVKAGSVLDVTYTLVTPYLYSIPKFNFQEDIPVDNAQLTIATSSEFNYQGVLVGSDLVDHSKIAIEREGYWIYEASQVPSMKDDQFVLNIEDYRASVYHELFSSTQFGISGRRIMLNTKYHSKSWDDVVAEILAEETFIDISENKLKPYKKFIKSIKKLPTKEKIAAVYEFVQSEFEWDGSLGLLPQNGKEQVLKSKTGNIADINLLLVNLLRSAGVHAYPYATKMRYDGELKPDIISVKQLNYILACIPYGDSHLLLDASCNITPVGQLPVRAINKAGLLIKKNGSAMVDFKNPNVYESFTMATYDLDIETPRLHGIGTNILKGFAATSYREMLMIESEEEYEDMEEDDESYEEDINLENVIDYNEALNVEDINKEISLTYNETIYNELDKIGDKIFINATIDFGIPENPFYEEDRNHPVFYSSLLDARQLITINIPDGYVVESLPESSILTLEDEKANFKYEVKQIGETIVIDYSMKMNSDTFSPDEYPSLKELYNRIVDKSKEKIVLMPKA